MILAHYECETDKKQSLEEHSFNVANKAREEASLPSRGRELKSNSLMIVITRLSRSLHGGVD